VTWLTPSKGELWRQVRALAGDVMGPPLNGYCFVRRVHQDKLYPIAATPTMTAAPQSDDIRPPEGAATSTMTAPHPSDDTRPPERGRGRILKYDWLAIAGEIARRCIDPKTRLLKIPKSERRLAKAMLEWCQEKHQKEPAHSQMREAVKIVCAALRVACK
jgi:hypothetical protein